MRGFGFRCDECGSLAVIEGDPFLRHGSIEFGPVPAGWVFLVRPQGAPGVAGERADLCSWACVESRARGEREA